MQYAGGFFVSGQTSVAKEHETGLAQEHMQRVLVTGATGFVGRALCAALVGSECEVIACARTPSPDVACSRFISCNLDTEFLADDHFAGVDTVIFLAGIAHAGRHAGIAARRYQRVNCDAAVHAARTALRCGVRHFHYISSVKAMGFESCVELLREADGIEPLDSYGKSKLAAEQQLLALAVGIPMKITISRPALVYGAAVKGNLRKLARLAAVRWMPNLPRAGFRSMIALPDLVAALQQFVHGYGRHGEIYILAGDVNCAADMVLAMRRRLGREVSTVTLPLFLFRALAVIGDALRRWRLPAPWDSAQYARLFGDLRFDTSKARDALEWHARYRFDDLAVKMLASELA